MIFALARRYKGRTLIAVLVVAYAIDFVVAPFIIANVTVPLLAEMVRMNPELQGFVDQALSIIPQEEP